MFLDLAALESVIIVWPSEFPPFVLTSRTVLHDKGYCPLLLRSDAWMFLATLMFMYAFYMLLFYMHLKLCLSSSTKQRKLVVIFKYDHIGSPFPLLFLVKHPEEGKKSIWLSWAIIIHLVTYDYLYLLYFGKTKLLPCTSHSVTKGCHYLNPFSRWSTSTPTRLLLWEQGTSVLLASTTRRPCTLASACSATPCLTGKSSPSPSAASSTAPPSSSATTGRSRATLRASARKCVFVNECVKVF